MLCSEALAQQKKKKKAFEFLQMHKTSKDGTTDQNLYVLPCFGLKVWYKWLHSPTKIEQVYRFQIICCYKDSGFLYEVTKEKSYKKTEEKNVFLYINRFIAEVNLKYMVCLFSHIPNCWFER